MARCDVRNLVAVSFHFCVRQMLNAFSRKAIKTSHTLPMSVAHRKMIASHCSNWLMTLRGVPSALHHLSREVLDPMRIHARNGANALGKSLRRDSGVATAGLENDGNGSRDRSSVGNCFSAGCHEYAFASEFVFKGYATVRPPADDATIT